ncbi:1-deoxy-D-xylulose 5-phosphate reductoisomerase [hydrothermal vent metagenome]|uniref:1-deoxy-D-xylulose-5-phosphate reductoisomerase n=1 Tax=hydrothermal vent metagenome TaxID=652676 RepID=A0A3B0Y426_9ZZZZ
MRQITILGSTGSIGVNTLDVIARHSDRYQVYALTANQAVERMLSQIQQFTPKFAVIVDHMAAHQLELLIKNLNQNQNVTIDTQILAGSDALCEVASAEAVTDVMAAIVGAAGLLPTLSAAYTGKKILLANKEALVMTGELMMDAVRDNNASLLPIDSEHNAIFQCMPSDSERQTVSNRSGVKKIILTGSGGPFRTTPVKDLENITPDEACAHPNWDMGRKISVDSATLMNKGLELIEACYLFNTTPDKVEIVIHPQSVVHSMVQYVDGSVLAQLGNPDMRTPIAHALAWPERIASGVEPLNLLEIAALEFEKPNDQKFPCLGLAREAILAGSFYTVSLNAANEVAVEQFLREKIGFTNIAEVISHVQKTITFDDIEVTVQSILAADAKSRQLAEYYIKQLIS